MTKANIWLAVVKVNLFYLGRSK